MPMLMPGDQFPKLELALPGGDSIVLPDAFGESWAYILFYRGGWCPYCHLELRALQKVLPEIKANNATLLAISPELPNHSLTAHEKN